MLFCWLLVEPDVLEEVKKKLDLGSVKFEVYMVIIYYESCSDNNSEDN